MSRRELFEKGKSRNRILVGISGIGCLIIGILLGWGLGGNFSLSAEETPSSQIAEPAAQNSPNLPLLSGAVLLGQEGPDAQNARLIEVAKLARPAVVNISTKQTQEQITEKSFPFFDDPFFRRFFGEKFEWKYEPPKAPPFQGEGSGVIISQDGYIVTNNHVVEEADSIQVVLSDKRSFSAEVVGTDPKTDLALLKIEEDNLPTLPWGDSQQLQVGELVMAIGNPFGLNQTVTMGIISAVGRANVGIVDYEDFIQTDAAINPGNSGGALVNLKGELVGINTAIFSRSGGYMGIGFAIPSNMAKAIQQSLIEHGKVVRGWLGVSIQDLTPDLQDQFNAPDTKGVLVSEVMKDSPAQKAGVHRGDIIREYESHVVSDSRHLRSLVAETLPGSSIHLAVLRDGDPHDLNVTIVEMPQDLTVLAASEEGQGKHGLAGVVVESLQSEHDDERKGVVVKRVEPISPAFRAGIQKGDIILEINREVVNDIKDFQILTQKLRPHEKVLVLLQRGKRSHFVTIKP